MLSIFGSVHILAVVAIQLLIIPSVSSLNLTNAYLHHKCNNTEGKYSHGSAFEKYINLALRAIDSDNFLNGFGYIERGEDPNKVFVMYQCRGDSYGSKCQSCISAAVSGVIVTSIYFFFCFSILLNSGHKLRAQMHVTFCLVKILEIYPMILTLYIIR